MIEQIFHFDPYSSKTAKWFVQWQGLTEEYKHCFYSKPEAYKHYIDVTRAGFKATTNAAPIKR